MLMQLPEGKLPGFYAQIVKGIASKVQLFDRDKELLVLDNEKDKEAVASVLEHYATSYEELPLLLLPAGARLYPLFEDYGFTSRSERSFLYAEQASLFQLENNSPEGEPAQALAQMEEHLLARCEQPGLGLVYAVDSQLVELMDGIAKAYGCKTIWL